MSRFWSPRVKELTPYVPGEQPKLKDLVKLNTNEHPLGPSPKVLEAIRAEAGDNLRLYPDPNGDVLKAKLADYHGVSTKQVFLGNGSDEVLAHIFFGLFQHGKPVLFPDITYSFYPVYCGIYHIEARAIPVAEDFSIRPEDYTGDCGGIIFPNPNAPSGRALALSDVERIVAGNPDVVVVIDEAYVDFGAESAIKLVDRYPNLLVTQTLSKSRSLAGLRVGFAVGHEDLIEALERVKNSFNSYPLDRLALVGAVAAYDDEDYFRHATDYVIRERQRVTEGLEQLGFDVVPSAANFVLARHPGHAGADLAAALRERSIIVRHFNKPRIEDHLRITIGSEAQNDALLGALPDIV